MANLPETAVWEPGIYQLETTDPVVGGVPNISTKAGASNISAAQLANRTSWLKAAVTTLQSLVVQATTSVAGVVRLNDTVNSTSTTEAATANAVKQVNDNANARVPGSRTVSGGGLATGGGDLTANRTITVAKASQAQAEAGTDDTVAMTPLTVKQAITALINTLIPAASTTVAGIVRLVNSVTSTSVTEAATAAAVKSANDNANSRVPGTRTISVGGLLQGGGDLAANRTLTVPVATQADAVAGTDGTLAMTPPTTLAAIASQNAASLGQSGFQRLPSGMILQWGRFSLGAAAAASQNVTFPTAFPTAFIAGFVGVDNAALNMIGINSWSRTGMLVAKGTGDNAARTGTWFAIGN